jgi:hypothetical protein
MEHSTHLARHEPRAPLLIPWIPGLLRMTHPVLRPPTWHPEWEAQIIEVYPCVTRLSSIPTPRLRCPCGQVIWTMNGVVWPEEPERPPGVYDLNGMTVQEVETLLDRVLPLEIQA